MKIYLKAALFVLAVYGAVAAVIGILIALTEFDLWWIVPCLVVVFLTIDLFRGKVRKLKEKQNRFN